MKCDYPKYKSWLEKCNKQEGNPLTLVCFEFYFVSAPPNSWWLDSDATFHVVVTLQGFISKWTPSEKRSKLRIENNAVVEVDFVRTISLI